MKLRQLQGMFIKHEGGGSFRLVNTLQEAQGMMFLCPKCFESNGGPVGTHAVICWFRNCGVPDNVTPGPGRWTPSGTGLDDLTFVPGEPKMPCSVDLGGKSCGKDRDQTGWHGHVRDGEAHLT